MKILKKPERTPMMKKNRFILLIIILILSSCASNEYWKVRIEVSQKPAVNLDKFKEFIITDFFVKKETKNFNINNELKDYFTTELGQTLENKISSKEIPLEKEDVFKDEDFWKNLSVDAKESVLFTGSIQYTQETRKALIKKLKKEQESPFPSESKFAQRKFYTLHLEVYLIDTQTGKIVYKRNFRETKAYKNPNQTAYFAFFDLVKNIKDKLFAHMLGIKKIQERYIISN